MVAVAVQPDEPADRRAGTEQEVDTGGVGRGHVDLLGGALVRPSRRLHGHVVPAWRHTLDLEVTAGIGGITAPPRHVDAVRVDADADDRCQAVGLGDTSGDATARHQREVDVADDRDGVRLGARRHRHRRGQVVLRRVVVELVNVVLRERRRAHPVLPGGHAAQGVVPVLIGVVAPHPVAAREVGRIDVEIDQPIPRHGVRDAARDRAAERDFEVDPRHAGSREPGRVGRHGIRVAPEHMVVVVLADEIREVEERRTGPLPWLDLHPVAPPGGQCIKDVIAAGVGVRVAQVLAGREIVRAQVHVDHRL